MYKKAKKESKKEISDAKFKGYDDLCNRLGTRKEEKDIFKLAKIREIKSIDLDHVKCIKSNDQKVLVKANDIKEMLREYFNKLLSEDYIGDIRTREYISLAEYTFFSRHRVVEVRKALKINTWEATSLDKIPIEAWKCLGEARGIWLTRLFNKILLTKKMSDEWSVRS